MDNQGLGMLDATSELAEQLERIGTQILNASRAELYFGMRFLDVALSSFDYQMNMEIAPFGTDGRSIFYHPQLLGGMYRRNRIQVNRGYLHMVYHCIFRHIVKPVNGNVWELSCDIAVEHLVDANYHRSVRSSKSLLRRETYRRLEQEANGKVLNAERIFKILQSWNLGEKELEKLEQEFYVDDHRYWESQKPNQQPDPILSQKWQDINEQMETDLETFSKETSQENGDFIGQIKIENRERHDYKSFLRKFSVFREEMGIDPDSFDYNFYSYGLSLYGNMPLIEPQETKEVKKIEEFAIVIDTSMSCSGELVQKFLEETYSVLKENESFFKKINVHIIQCDEQVHSDCKITSEEDLKEYMEHMELYGQGGTDFRPAFEYVEQLVSEKEVHDLRGLIYFTDGYGIYPNRMPPFKTAFVFMQEDYTDVDVPVWAIKLILSEDELG